MTHQCVAAQWLKIEVFEGADGGKYSYFPNEMSYKDIGTNIRWHRAIAVYALVNAGVSVSV